MIRWLIVIFLILVLVNFFSPILRDFGFGKLPGDFRFRLFGREMYLPVTTTVLLSMAAGVIARYA